MRRWKGVLVAWGAGVLASFALGANLTGSYAVELRGVPPLGIAPGGTTVAWGEVSVHTPDGRRLGVWREGVGAAAATDEFLYVGLGGGEVEIRDRANGKLVDRLPVFASMDPTMGAAWGETAVLAAPSGEVNLFHRGRLVLHVMVPGGEVVGVAAGKFRALVRLAASDGKALFYELAPGGARRLSIGDGRGLFGYDRTGTNPIFLGEGEGYYARGALIAQRPPTQEGVWSYDGKWWVNLETAEVRLDPGDPGKKLRVLRPSVRALTAGEGEEVFAAAEGGLWRLRFGVAGGEVLAERALERNAWPTLLAYQEREGRLLGYVNGRLAAWVLPELTPGKSVRFLANVTALSIGADGELLVGRMFGDAYAMERGGVRLLGDGLGKVVRVYRWRNAAGEPRLLVVGDRRVLYRPGEGPSVYLKVPGGMRVLDAALSPDRSRLVLVGDEIAWIDLPPNGERRFERMPPPSPSWIPAAAFPLPGVLAVGTSRGEVVLLDLDRRSELLRVRDFLATVQWLHGDGRGRLVVSTGRTCCPGALSVLWFRR